jgi:rod shape-determining protein MreC
VIGEGAVARVLDTRKSRFLLAGLVLGHLVIISQQVQVEGGSGGGARLLEHTVFRFLSPFQRLAGGAVAGVAGTWHGYVDLRRVHAESQDLHERVRVLETDLLEAREQVREAERLREIAGVKPQLPLDTLVARVIATDGLPWFRNITIDRGLVDGVALNAPVMSAQGVVGRVIAVGPQAARVQILLDKSSSVGVRIERSRITGVVTGKAGYGDAAGGDLDLMYVPVLADVVVGDVVVTSGLDRIHPRGLMVGRVRSVTGGSGLFKEIVVAPSARFERLEEVMVVRRRAEDLRFTRALRAEPSASPR